jgi:hypothetical protein
MFNKHYQPGSIECGICIKCVVQFSVKEKEGDDSLSKNQSENWENFTHRNGGALAAFISEILKPYIAAVASDKSTTFGWSASIMEEDLSCPEHLDILVTEIAYPDPEIVQCRTPKCPYKNFFGVCRNCENEPFANLDHTAMEAHQEEIEQFEEDIQHAEEEEHITVLGPIKVDGYIPEVGTIEMTALPYKEKELENNVTPFLMQ